MFLFMFDMRECFIQYISICFIKRGVITLSTGTPDMPVFITVYFPQERERDAMVTVGPKYGVAVVTNIKNNTVSSNLYHITYCKLSNV